MTINRVSKILYKIKAKFRSTPAVWIELRRIVEDVFQETRRIRATTKDFRHILRTKEEKFEE